MKTTYVRAWVNGLLIAMIGLGAGCSTFELSSTPSADIYENEVKIGETPYAFNLVSGTRQFVLKSFGFIEEDVSVSSLDQKKLHVNLRWVGKTRVNSKPQGSKVFRKSDNEYLGTSPCSLHLDHPERVVLRLEGFEPYELDLTPNETYAAELQAVSGFQSVVFKDIMFMSNQGPIEIYDRIAGKRIGVTPKRLQVEVGASLEYRFKGHKSKYELISRNAPVRIEISLEPYTRVTIKGAEGAGVYHVGGFEKIGTLPYYVEVEGSALYEIRKEGFYDRTLPVAAGSPAVIHVELEAIPYKTIATVPTGAEIYRLGGIEKLGSAPYKTIMKEERVFEVKKAGYQSITIGMGPNSAETLTVPLEPMPLEDPDAAAIGTFNNEAIGSF